MESRTSLTMRAAKLSRARDDEAAYVDRLILDRRFDPAAPIDAGGGAGSAGGSASTGCPASNSTGASAASVMSRRSGNKCNSYNTFDTSTGRTCFGSTPRAPSARACPTYSSPSCEVYIMIGIIAVCGLPLIAFTACKPSMPGMR